MVLLLSRLGHEARGTTLGLEAIEIFATFDPDVAIIDLSLPDMDGCRLAREIRGLAGRRTPILIAFTGWARRIDFDDTYAAGFDYHIVKPSTVGTLEMLVRSRPVSRHCRRKTDPPHAPM